MQWASAGSADKMGRAVRYQEMLRRLAIVDERFVGDQAGLVFGPDGVLGPGSQDRGAGAGRGAGGDRGAGGLPGMGQHPCAGVGATEEEITSVLLAIAPVIGLGRVVGAAPGVAGAFGYDIEPRWMTQMVPDGSPGSAGQRRATPRRGRLIKPRPAGLLGLSWADGDGMGSPSPQPSDNLDQVPILEPEIPAGGRQDQPPGSGATSPGTMARCLPSLVLRTLDFTW